MVQPIQKRRTIGQSVGSALSGFFFGQSDEAAFVSRLREARDQSGGTLSPQTIENLRRTVSLTDPGMLGAFDSAVSKVRVDKDIPQISKAFQVSTPEHPVQAQVALGTPPPVLEQEGAGSSSLDQFAQFQQIIDASISGLHDAGAADRTALRADIDAQLEAFRVLAEPQERPKHEKLQRLLVGAAAGALPALRGQSEGSLARVIAGAGAGALGQNITLQHEIRAEDSKRDEILREAELRAVQFDLSLAQLEQADTRTSIARAQLGANQASLFLSNFGPIAQARIAQSQASQNAANSQAALNGLKIRLLQTGGDIKAQLNGAEIDTAGLPEPSKSLFKWAFFSATGAINPGQRELLVDSIMESVNPITGEELLDKLSGEPVGEKIKLLRQSGQTDEAEQLLMNTLMDLLVAQAMQNPGAALQNLLQMGSQVTPSQVNTAQPLAP